MNGRNEHELQEQKKNFQIIKHDTKTICFHVP